MCIQALEMLYTLYVALLAEWDLISVLLLPPLLLLLLLLLLLPLLHRLSLKEFERIFTAFERISTEPPAAETFVREAWTVLPYMNGHVFTRLSLADIDFSETNVMYRRWRCLNGEYCISLPLSEDFNVDELNRNCYTAFMKLCSNFAFHVPSLFEGLCDADRLGSSNKWIRYFLSVVSHYFRCVDGFVDNIGMDVIWYYRI